MKLLNRDRIFILCCGNFKNLRILNINKFIHIVDCLIHKSEKIQMKNNHVLTINRLINKCSLSL